MGSLRPSWSHLGQSWALLGPFWPSWRPSWASWRPLEPSLGPLGAVLGASGAVLGHLGALLGSSWRLLGSPGGPLGAILEAIDQKRGALKFDSWGALGVLLGGFLGALEGSWGNLGGHRSKDGRVPIDAPPLRATILVRGVKKWPSQRPKKDPLTHRDRPRPGPGEGVGGGVNPSPKGKREGGRGNALHHLRSEGW